MQMKTILVAKVPRVKCDGHGVHRPPAARAITDAYADKLAEVNAWLAEHQR